jgi:hypothetical protein
MCPEELAYSESIVGGASQAEPVTQSIDKQHQIARCGMASLAGHGM